MKYTALIFILLIILVFTLINLVSLIFFRVPTSNTSRTAFDVIIVLGSPANSDGGPSEVMKQRVIEGVKRFYQGQAKHILFTGSAVYSEFIEADVMSEFAHSLGVPKDAILTDTKSKNTYQNIFNSIGVMRDQNWLSALVVTSPSHIQRTSFILSTYDIEYRVIGSHIPPKLWAWELIVGQWEKYIITRLFFSGYSQTYGLIKGE
ncbi:YdcF family protein [Synechococcus elongatus IITB4]|uniref:YdcF family protein n=1 Tax=Synechococcus elongatus TaxID=32046 RepID=UPI0030CF8F0F